MREHGAVRLIAERDVATAERISALEADNTSLRRALRLLHDIGALVNQSLDLRTTLRAALTGVTAGVGLGMNRALLFLFDEQGRDQLRCAAAVGPRTREEAEHIWKSIETKQLDLPALHATSRGSEEPELLGLCVDVRGHTPMALALREGRLVQHEGLDDHGALLDLHTCIAAPLTALDRTHGVLYADNRFTGRVPDAHTALVFSMVAEHAARAIENARRYERAAHQARTDALTGLGHHGAVMEALSQALATRQGDAQVGLAMIDIDYFKRVNDTYGHLAGDALLAELAARLRASCRADEEPFRYGGEEFAVVLRDATESALSSLGERLRSAVAARPFRVDDARELAITCSVGLARAGAHATVEELIHAADTALLRAKATGRDRVVVAAPSF